MEEQKEPRLSDAERRVIQELRRTQFGELRIVMRNGRPVQMETTKSQKLDER